MAKLLEIRAEQHQTAGPCVAPQASAAAADTVTTMREVTNSQSAPLAAVVPQANTESGRPEPSEVAESGASGNGCVMPADDASVPSAETPTSVTPVVVRSAKTNGDDFDTVASRQSSLKHQQTLAAMLADMEATTLAAQNHAKSLSSMSLDDT